MSTTAFRSPTDWTDTMTNEENLSNNVTRAASPVNMSIQSLRAGLAMAGHMTVLTKEGDGAKFDAENVSWNKDVCKHTPAIIVQPTSTADVCVVVKAAREHGARLVIAGGRHGHDCLAHDAVVLDLSKMKKVGVDTDRKVVTVEGGCKLGDMDKACAAHGLGCVTGTNPDTGVVGLSTAGGGGYLTRLHGMAVDNFVSATVVLASGEAVIATKTNEHKELLWGLQGAGSNFGVVTELTMKAHVVDKVFGGLVINVALRASTSRSILAHWKDFITSAPRSVMSMAVLPCGAPVVPTVVVETDANVVPQADDAKVTKGMIPSLAPITSRVGAFGSCASIKQLGRKQYHTEMQPLLESLQASGHYYDASCIVPELSPEVIATLVDFTRVQNVNKVAGIIVFPMGAAVADAQTGDTAFYGGGRKQNAFWIIIEGKWEPDATGKNREAVVDWVKRLRKALAQFDVTDTAHTLDGNMESELAGASAIFGPNLERLRDVKAKYDPENYFKCNRNITPGRVYETNA